MARAGVTNDKIAEIKATWGEEATEAGLILLEGRRLRGTIHDYRHVQIVYYMRMDRLVKIGTTTNLRQRVGQIMPQGVMAVETGDHYVERRRHGQFWADHSHGEWYWLREPLWAHIAEVRTAFEANAGKTTEQWLADHGVT
jgi:hypothetical protein